MVPTCFPIRYEYRVLYWLQLVRRGSLGLYSQTFASWLASREDGGDGGAGSVVMMAMVVVVMVVVVAVWKIPMAIGMWSYKINAKGHSCSRESMQKSEFKQSILGGGV